MTKDGNDSFNLKSNLSCNLSTFHSFVADSAILSLPTSTQYRFWMNMNVEHWWNRTERGKPKKKTSVPVPLHHESQNLTQTAKVYNPGFCGKKPPAIDGRCHIRPISCEVHLWLFDNKLAGSQVNIKTKGADTVNMKRHYS
jgi:hypothetical protein